MKVWVMSRYWFKLIGLAFIVACVVTVVMEMKGYLYIYKSYVEIDVRSGREKETKYILGIKYFEKVNETELYKSLVNKKAEWKLAGGQQGLIFANTVCCDYGRVLAVKRMLIQQFNENDVSEYDRAIMMEKFLNKAKMSVENSQTHF